MKSKIEQTIIAGFIATAVMIIVGLMAPYMGLPKMNPSKMLAGMMGTSTIIGYVMHFMIGIIFAACYVYLFNPKVNIGSKFLKGLLFGLTVFVFAQIVMLLIGMVKPMPAMGDKTLMMIGSLIGHFVYGVIIALVVLNYAITSERKNIKTAQAY